MNMQISIIWFKFISADRIFHRLKLDTFYLSLYLWKLNDFSYFFVPSVSFYRCYVVWRENVTAPALALIIIIVTCVNVTLNMSLCVREQADIEIEYIFAQAPTHRHSIGNIFQCSCMTSTIRAPYMSSLCNSEFLSMNCSFYSAL